MTLASKGRQDPQQFQLKEEPGILTGSEGISLVSTSLVSTSFLLRL